MRAETILEAEGVFVQGRRVIVQQDGAAVVREIEFSQIQHGRRIVKLRGIDSIEGAEKLVGAVLVVPENELPAVDEGHFYTFRLKGCRVFSNAEDLGVVVGVLDSGGTPILQVEGGDGEILIPFAQAYLRNVDIGQQRIDVDLPEGLRELNK